MKGESWPEARPGSAQLVIADDHDLVREGLRAVLDGEPDLQVVGEAKNGREALDLYRELRPDLVLMDVRMPETDGLAATRAIKEEFPEMSVVMVTMDENPDYLLEAIDAGAAGYVLKGAPDDRLVDAVRRTLNDESPLNEQLAMRLRRLAGEKEQQPQPASETKNHPEPTLISANSSVMLMTPQACRSSITSEPAR